MLFSFAGWCVKKDAIELIVPYSAMGCCFSEIELQPEMSQFLVEHLIDIEVERFHHACFEGRYMITFSAYS